MSKKHLLVMTVLALVFMGGCWDYRDINTSAIPTAVAVELGKDKKLTITAQFIQPLPPGETASAKNKPLVFSASDYSQTTAARRIMLSLPKVPEWSHVNTFIMGENLIRSDLFLVVDFMLRTRALRPDINLLAVVKVPPEKILSAQIPQVNNLGKGLNDLLDLQQEQLGIYVPTTFAEFTYKVLTPGIEPAVPLITLQEENDQGKNAKKTGDKNDKNTNTRKSKIILVGTGVFKGRRMTGALNETESRGLRWLSSSASRKGGIVVTNSPLNSQENITLEIKRFRSTTRPVLSDGRLRMEIKVEAVLSYFDQNGTGQLLTGPMLKKMEQNAGREIKNQITRCINRSQELNSDILGWGLTVQEYKPYEWEKVAGDWNEMFPSIENHIQVQTKIKQTDLTSKSFSFE